MIENELESKSEKPTEPAQAVKSTTLEPYSEKVAAYALWFFLGALGAHRFYAHRNASAIAMLALCVGGWIAFLAGGGGLAYGIANEAVGTGVSGMAGLIVGGLAIAANAGWWCVDAILIALWKQEKLDGSEKSAKS
jgi:TM2 domain-containing membrane protein YozV